jgi:bifunctional non-homologous end joining protein LigD
VAKAAASALKEYRAKRNFRATPEPGPGPTRRGGKLPRQPIFVIQEHHATRLHYDFRLESDGVLKSWAVTNMPTMDPAIKRLAVRVEDHPRAYAKFFGDIPEGQYGAGHVNIWDSGTYEMADAKRTIDEDLAAGKLSIVLHGERLKGRFVLVRMHGQSGTKENWLLIKSTDESSPPGSGLAANREAPRKAKSRRPAVISGHGKLPRQVAITNPDKIMFPNAGITKGDLIEYYRKVSKRLLPFLRDRPITLERLPDGLGPGKPHFWQKNTPESYPAWIPRFRDKAEGGQTVNYVLVNDLQSLLYLVNQGTVTFHPWLSRIEDTNRPDFVLFDLDRGTAPITNVVAVAQTVHRILDHEGVTAFVKTSGKSGLHVLTAWRRRGDFDEARRWAAEIAARVVEAMAEVATNEVRKTKRRGRVYVDVAQNARGHHAVPPYVVRPVPAATVSTPLQWKELTASLDPKRFTVRTVPARIARQARDPLAPLVRRSKTTWRSA